MNPIERMTALKAKGYLILAVVGPREGMRAGLVCASLPRAVAGLGRMGITKICLISGGARGVDMWASDYWEACGLGPLEVLEADWQTHGDSAGPRRNSELVSVADLVLAHWDGQSRGTGDTVQKSRAAGKLWVVVGVDGSIVERPDLRPGLLAEVRSRG